MATDEDRSAWRSCVQTDEASRHARVLVTIPTIAGREVLLDRLLESLENQLGPEDAIAVHANGSAWDPPEGSMIKVYRRPEGTGPIFRFDLHDWTCDYLLSLDDDLVPNPAYIQTTIERLDQLREWWDDRAYALSWYARHWTSPKEAEDRYWVDGDSNFRTRITVDAESSQWTLTTYAGCGAFACRGDVLPLLRGAEKPHQYEHHDDLWLNGVLSAAGIAVVRPPGPASLLTAETTPSSLYSHARDNRFAQREENMRDAFGRWGWQPISPQELSHRTAPTR